MSTWQRTIYRGHEVYEKHILGFFLYGSRKDGKIEMLRISRRKRMIGIFLRRTNYGARAGVRGGFEVFTHRIAFGRGTRLTDFRRNRRAFSGSMNDPYRSMILARGKWFVSFRTPDRIRHKEEKRRIDLYEVDYE